MYHRFVAKKSTTEMAPKRDAFLSRFRERSAGSKQPLAKGDRNTATNKNAMGTSTSVFLSFAEFPTPDPEGAECLGNKSGAEARLGGRGTYVRIKCKVKCN